MAELSVRKTELATMCRISEVTEIRAYIEFIKSRIEEKSTDIELKDKNLF